MTWTLASLAILGLALAMGFAWYERSHPTARVLALVAVLAALAAIGRIAFAPIPNVTPTTGIVLLSGYALGGAPGFAVGAVAALASNLFFGQGPWTPWQMTGWGLVGVLGAALALGSGRRLGRVALALACGAAALAYGAVMNVSMWVLYSGDHTLAKLGAYFAGSAAFDLAHAIGSVVFCLAFGPVLVAALTRYRRRFTVTWGPAPAAAAALAGALVVVLAAPAPGAAAAAPERAVRYVLDAQNRDGGFPPAPRAASTQLHTGWAALGLAAAGRNPRDVGALRYIRAGGGGLSDVGELSRTILVLVAAGENPRRYAGRDWVAELLRRRGTGPAWAGRVNSTAFALLALRAARRPATSRPVLRGRRWIERQANPDGGFNFAGRGGPSGIDDTAAAVQALVAARGSRLVVRRAVRFLVRRQNGDGGFPLQPGGASNAQSTAWAVQALVAAGRNPDRVRRSGSRSPSAFLRRLMQPDGAIRYSRTSAQTPVWVTSQAIAALARRPLPLRPVPRRARGSRSAPAAVQAASAPAPAAAPEAPEAAAAAASSATPAAGEREAEDVPARTHEREAHPEKDLLRAARVAGFAVGVVLSPVL
jgi:prenyltransferase beta subunit